MIGVPSTERLFSLSCFEGLRLLRTYAVQHVDTAIEELLLLIESAEADAHSLDMEAAAHLHVSVSPDCPLIGVHFYQECIKSVVVTHQPIWSKSMRQGRVRFVHSLDSDDRDVFSAAGLLENPPSTSVVNWWDDVVGHARLAVDYEKMVQARAAELLTINWEKSRLQELGISKSPEWTGLDDNFAGYDVLSYDLDGENEINRMIEVKSTTNSPLRFFLSRNEWNTADKIGSAYHFHIWNMSADPPVLYERSVEEIRPHIPSDNEKGKWSNVAVPVGC
ncbi:DUF3883 domain-containing protein [Maritalea sp.]|jgi:hypothetical protein|uniref:DUF3883 domain-containing protein n=1 Tax=Maritalea sp. TaxID=2003361 RepID=UPI0039E59D69